MKMLRRMGVCAATAVVAGGVVLSVFFLQLNVVLLVFVLTALVAGTVWYVCSDGEHSGWAVVRSAATTSVVVLAVCTYAVVIGNGLWAVPALAAIAGGRYLRERRGQTTEEPAVLSNHDICVAWRRSYPTLQRATNAEQRQRIVAQRQTYLDELERRQPKAFLEWLETHPHPASDPERFFDRA
jgi:hypothetical protein